MKIIRLYGKTVRCWKALETFTNVAGQIREREIVTHFEKEYSEFHDGEFHHTGTEDFSIERWESMVKDRAVYVWDGKKRNRGGYKWWKYEGRVMFYGKSADMKEFWAKKYPTAEEIQFRKY